MENIRCQCDCQQVLQASSWKHDYTVVMIPFDLFSFLSNQVVNICHEMSEGQLIPSFCVCSNVSEWNMGEGKLLTVPLPEHLRTAIELASKLWLR